VKRVLRDARIPMALALLAALAVAGRQARADEAPPPRATAEAPPAAPPAPPAPPPAAPAERSTITAQPDPAAPPAPSAPPAPPGDLEVGLSHFQARRFAQAWPFLERAVAAEPANLDARLLLGITLYRLGKDRLAEPHLRAATRAGEPETASSARFFLGLQAVERGERDAAQGLLSGVAGSQSPVLAESGRLVLERAAPKPLTLLLLIRPEFDSNVKLLPSAPTPTSATGAQADGDLLFLGSLSYRPWRSVGLTFEETASYRQQFTILDYSIFGNAIGPRYAYLGSNDRPWVAYAFELQTLGSQLLLLGHSVDAGYRRRLVRDLWIGARYLFRYRQYYADGYTPFTGPAHNGAVEISWGAPERPFELSAGYLVVREVTEDDHYTATGHGGRLYGRRRFSSRLELSASFWAIHRTFDEIDTGFSPRRIDTQIYADAALGIDLHRHLGLIVGAQVLRNFSTDPSFDYLKVTGYVGLAYLFTGP
jgi:hypothetical protein